MSAASKKVWSAIIYSRGISAMILEQTTGDDVDGRRLAVNLMRRCDDCMGAFPCMLSSKEAHEIMRKVVTKLGDVLEKPIEATVHTSLALALLDEPLSKITDAKRLMALQRVRAALQAVHDNYERGIVEAYDLAKILAENFTNDKKS